jgi:hypothetical protein
VCCSLHDFDCVVETNGITKVQNTFPVFIVISHQLHVPVMESVKKIYVQRTESKVYT